MDAAMTNVVEALTETARNCGHTIDELSTGTYQHVSTLLIFNYYR
jgi:hypothetical protein